MCIFGGIMESFYLGEKINSDLLTILCSLERKGSQQKVPYPSVTRETQMLYGPTHC